MNGNARVPWTTLRAWLACNRLRILMYHSISTRADRLAVSPARFAEQMRYLAENRFRVISLREACARLDARGDLKRTIVLTFDDSYRDFLTAAAPVLMPYAFPATLFVAANQIGKSDLCLSMSELCEVGTLGFALGSHSMTHPDLRTLDDGALVRELTESRALIAGFGETFLPFAYPGGAFTHRERDAAQRAGYDCAVIVGGRWGNGAETDRFLLKREPMLASDSLDWFARRVEGYYEWHYVTARLRGVKTR